MLFQDLGKIFISFGIQLQIFTSIKVKKAKELENILKIILTEKKIEVIIKIRSN